MATGAVVVEELATPGELGVSDGLRGLAEAARGSRCETVHQRARRNANLDEGKRASPPASHLILQAIQAALACVSLPSDTETGMP